MTGKCKVANCEGEVTNKTNSLCNKHYLRLLRHGDPLGGSSFRNSQQWIAENKGFQGEDCLIWP